MTYVISIYAVYTKWGVALQQGAASLFLIFKKNRADGMQNPNTYCH